MPILPPDVCFRGWTGHAVQAGQLGHWVAALGADCLPAALSQGAGFSPCKRLLRGHMQRRAFITLLGAAATWPQAVLAQQAGKIPRIGVLWHAGSAEEEGPYFRGLIEGLRGLGYIDGRNIMLEHRFPNETPDRFRSMAAELVSLKVD